MHRKAVIQARPKEIQHFKVSNKSYTKKRRRNNGNSHINIKIYRLVYIALFTTNDQEIIEESLHYLNKIAENQYFPFGKTRKMIKLHKCPSIYIENPNYETKIIYDVADGDYYLKEGNFHKAKECFISALNSSIYIEEKYRVYYRLLLLSKLLNDTFIDIGDIENIINKDLEINKGVMYYYYIELRALLLIYKDRNESIQLFIECLENQSNESLLLNRDYLLLYCCLLSLSCSELDEIVRLFYLNSSIYTKLGKDFNLSYLLMNLINGNYVVCLGEVSCLEQFIFSDIFLPNELCCDIYNNIVRIFLKPYSEISLNSITEKAGIKNPNEIINKLIEKNIITGKITNIEGSLNYKN